MIVVKGQRLIVYRLSVVNDDLSPRFFNTSDLEPLCRRLLCQAAERTVVNGPIFSCVGGAVERAAVKEPCVKGAASLALASKRCTPVGAAT